MPLGPLKQEGHVEHGIGVAGIGFERAIKARDRLLGAALAIQYGAEGVGLCRTEHQFLGERLPLVRRYLLATEPAEEAEALAELAAAQKEDFLDLLAVTGSRPVTVRLLDAPLHEFLGESAQEVNPMLGLRGVRLALLRTELYPAQARALFSAWVDIDIVAS